MELNPRLCVAARAVLGWSQADLAQRAGVARATVADYERAARTPIANNLRAIVRCLEAAGIGFLDPAIHGGMGLIWPTKNGTASVVLRDG